MNEEKLKAEKECFIARNIRFRGDQTNPNFKSFQVSSDRKRVSYKANNHTAVFNHCQLLSDKGIYYFKANIEAGIKIQLGICSHRIIPLIDDQLLNHTEYMGLNLYGHLYGNGAKVLVVGGMKVAKGQTVKVVIDMNTKHIQWYLDNNLLHNTPIRKELLQNRICAVVAMNNIGIPSRLQRID